MDWQRPVDAYCERTSAAFWAEPVNALTNAAFLIAAMVALAMLRREADRDVAALWLILLVVLIGIGSFLFHTVATVWAALADVVPITVFIVSFLVLTVRRFFAGPWWLALATGVLFLPSAGALEHVVESFAGGTLGGSEGYLPALLALIVLGAWLGRRGHPSGRPLLAGALLFVVSLTFRTIDGPICPLVPLGTHFLWHLLNSVLLGWLVVTFIRHGRPALKAV